MSNLPGDLSADPPGELLPATAQVREAVPELAQHNPKQSPVEEKRASNTAKVDSDDEDEDEDEDGGEEAAYDGGIKLRDLSGSEVQQFPGLKREHWW
jgi:hypothetical protein